MHRKSPLNIKKDNNFLNRFRLQRNIYDFSYIKSSFGFTRARAVLTHVSGAIAVLKPLDVRADAFSYFCPALTLLEPVETGLTRKIFCSSRCIHAGTAEPAAGVCSMEIRKIFLSGTCAPL